MNGKSAEEIELLRQCLSYEEKQRPRLPPEVVESLREPITLAQALSRFLDAKETEGMKPATVKHYWKLANQLVTLILPDMPAAKVTTEQLRSVLDAKARAGRNIATRRAYRSFFRMVFSWLVRQTPPLIPADPTAGLGPLKPKAGEAPPVAKKPVESASTGASWWSFARRRCFRGAGSSRTRSPRASSRSSGRSLPASPQRRLRSNSSSRMRLSPIG